MGLTAINYWHDLWSMIIIIIIFFLNKYIFHWLQNNCISNPIHMLKLNFYFSLSLKSDQLMSIIHIRTKKVLTFIMLVVYSLTNNHYDRHSQNSF